MDQYALRTGESLTYEKLARRSGLSKATLESIASRRDYNPTLETVDRLCAALMCQPGDLLAYKKTRPRDSSRLEQHEPSSTPTIR